MPSNETCPLRTSKDNQDFNEAEEFMKTQRRLTKAYKKWKKFADECEHRSDKILFGFICNALKKKGQVLCGCSPMSCICLRDGANRQEFIPWSLKRDPNEE
jgi:hypothetical protein